MKSLSTGSLQFNNVVICILFLIALGACSSGSTDLSGDIANIGNLESNADVPSIPSANTDDAVVVALNASGFEYYPPVHPVLGAATTNTELTNNSIEAPTQTSVDTQMPESQQLTTSEPTNIVAVPVDNPASTTVAVTVVEENSMAVPESVKPIDSSLDSQLQEPQPASATVPVEIETSKVADITSAPTNGDESQQQSTMEQASIPDVEAVTESASQSLPSEDTMIIVGSEPGDAQCFDFGEQSQNFGEVSDDDWRGWMPDFRFATGEQHLAVINDSGQSVLQHKYEPTSRGSDRVVVASNIEPHQTYRIRQSVYFEPDWEWGGDTYEGGKLGFGFGGGTAPSGGIVDPAGFTARIMWRGNYLGGGEYDGTGRLVIYSYNADRPKNIGEDTQLGEYSVPIGEWFDVVYEIHTNSSTDVSDGWMKAWVNGELLMERDGIAWQTEGGKPVIDTLYYSSFYGGGNSGWAPSKTTYSRYKDVCWAPVVDGYSGIDPDTGRIDVDHSSINEGPLNDESNGLELPSWIKHQLELLGATEEATIYIKVISLEASVSAYQYYSNAVSNLNQALFSLNTDDHSSVGESPILAASKAISDLNSALNLNTISATEREEVLSTLDFIELTVLKMPELAEMKAESARFAHGCLDLNAALPACQESLSFSNEANIAIESLSDPTKDWDELAWFAEHAWNRSVDAVNALDAEQSLKN